MFMPEYNPMRGSDYRQCALYNIQEDRTYVCWLPLKYAVKGKILHLDAYPGITWRVGRVFKTVRSSEQISQAKDEYRYHRDVTDV